MRTWSVLRPSVRALLAAATCIACGQSPSTVEDAGAVDAGLEVDTAACRLDAPICLPGERATSVLQGILDRCGFVAPPPSRCMDVAIELSGSCVTGSYLSNLTVPVASCVDKAVANGYWPCTSLPSVHLSYGTCE